MALQLPGSTAESRKDIINETVRQFFPHATPSDTETYETIEEHVRTHGYYLQKINDVDIPESGYFSSWLEYVFEPILLAISHQRASTNLSDPLLAYIRISGYWEQIRQQRAMYDYTDIDAVVLRYLADA